MSATHSNDEVRPALGASVRAVLAEWYRAVRSTGGTQRVRALVLLAHETQEFCWKQQIIHRVYANGQSQPITVGELEQVTRAIAYGWFLVYLQAGDGQEALVLHQLGHCVPHQLLQPQDLALLLQEHEPPPAGTAVPPSTETGRVEAAARDGVPPTPLPVSFPDQRTGTPLAGNRGPDRRPGWFRWFLVRAGIVGEGTLLFGEILVLTRNPLFCLGALGMLVILVLRRLCRPRTQGSPE